MTNKILALQYAELIKTLMSGDPDTIEENPFTVAAEAFRQHVIARRVYEKDKMAALLMVDGSMIVTASDGMAVATPQDVLNGYMHTLIRRRAEGLTFAEAGSHEITGPTQH
jgi:hypothetical protein